MKLLYISTHSDLSGAPLHVCTLANERLRRGDTVLIAFGGPGDAFRTVDTRATLIPLEGLSGNWSPLTFFRGLWDTWNTIRIHRPDLVHLHSAKAGLLGRLACALLGARSVYTVHGWSFSPGTPPLQRLIGFSIEWLAARFLPSTFVCVSEADRVLARSRLRLRASTLHLVRNGVRPPAFVRFHDQNDSSALTVTMVARVGHQKDHSAFVSGLTHASGVWRGALVGSGTDRREGWGPRVEGTGPSTDIPSYWLRSDVAALMSRYEGLPLSIIEAMAHGLPVLGSDVGGVSELIVEGETGFLLKTNNPEDFAEKLRLLADVGLRAKMGRSAHLRYTNSFSEDAMHHALDGVYAGKAASP